MVSYSGSVLVVQPEGDSDTLRVTVRPATRVMEQQAKSFSDIQVGDFIGATLVKNSMGVPLAQELHIFPKAMAGSGEGIYLPAAGAPAMVLNGVVGQIDKGRIGVKFRGATGDGPYNGGKGCNGRAPVDPLSGCQGSIIVPVQNGAPITALVDADKTHVVPGAVLALSILSGPDGKPVTPGFTIQSLPSDTPAPKLANSRPKTVIGKVPR